jgi:hypothetical protein
VAAMRRQRRHLDARWPPRPTCSLTPTAPCLSSPTPSYLPPHQASGSRARVGEPSPPPARALVGVVRLGHLSSPPASLSCSELRLSLVVSFPSTGIARRSPGRAHWRTPLRGLLPSAPPFSFSVRASRSPCFLGARAHLPVSSPGRR